MLLSPEQEVFSSAFSHLCSDPYSKDFPAHFAYACILHLLTQAAVSCEQEQ